MSDDVVPIRKYLAGDMLAHVIGYTGEVSQDELEKNDLDGLESRRYGRENMGSKNILTHIWAGKVVPNRSK